MTDPHLSSDRISALAAGTLAKDEHRQALAHVEECPVCRADLTFVVGFERRRRRRRTAALAVGLAAVLAGVALLPTGSVAPTPDTFRSNDEGIPIVASHAPGDGAAVSGRVGFVWQHMGEGASYRFHVSGHDGAPILERALQDTVVYLDLAAELAADRTYFWFVDALLADGGAARSNVWSFTTRE